MENWKRRLLGAISRQGEINHDVRGERRLHQRVLQLGLEDYVKHRDKDFTKQSSEIKSQFYSARNWMFNTKEPRHLLDTAMSFNNVCLILDLEPNGIRKLAKEMTVEELRVWIRVRS